MEKNEQQQQRRGRIRLLLVLAICAAPMLLSYLMYYVIKPTGRTNYGVILDPRDYPMPALQATQLDSTPASLEDFRGKWIMLQVGPSECTEACREQLHKMRQLRLMQGKEMERIERVWLMTDTAPIDTMLIREYEDVHMLRANAEVLKAWLPTESDTIEAEHIYMIDPLGNLMMRFPKNSDPGKMKKDISKLLRASSIG